MLDAFQAHPDTSSARASDFEACDQTSYRYDAQMCEEQRSEEEYQKNRREQQEIEMLGVGLVRHCSVREGVIAAANVSRAVNCLAVDSWRPDSGLRLSIRR